MYERLSRAAVTCPKEVVDWLWDLDHNYGRVQLNAGRKGSAGVRSADPCAPRRQAVSVPLWLARATVSLKGCSTRGLRLWGADISGRAWYFCPCGDFAQSPSSGSKRLQSFTVSCRLQSARRKTDASTAWTSL